MLLHPLGADRRVWRPVLEHLTDHREVICIDLPGFGDSQPLSCRRPPTPARLAVAVVELVDELGLGGGAAHLAGNSLGGWVALEAAAAGHAATVTAIAPAGLWSRRLAPKPQTARWLARIALPVVAPAIRLSVVRRLAFSAIAAHPERISPTEAVAMIRAYARAPGFTAVNRAMRAGAFTRLADIEVPVTLVWPERDRLIVPPRTVPPTVRNVTLPGCGHLPMWDDPQAVAAALLAGSSAERTLA